MSIKTTPGKCTNKTQKKKFLNIILRYKKKITDDEKIIIFNNTVSPSNAVVDKLKFLQNVLLAIVYYSQVRSPGNRRITRGGAGIWPSQTTWKLQEETTSELHMSGTDRNMGRYLHDRGEETNER